MRAIEITQPGGPEVLQETQRPGASARLRRGVDSGAGGWGE